MKSWIPYGICLLHVVLVVLVTQPVHDAKGGRHAIPILWVKIV